ncbi:hypothetical protein HYW35_03660 [Candidatus Saccharibacteria bacterium]|nr:hypothetical protein [Candidatus Saccharibacteria bacterium]
MNSPTPERFPIDGLVGLNNDDFSSGDPSLSGDYGSLRTDKPKWAVSNDQGFKDLAPIIQDRLRSIRGGIGLFIGAGGMLSILPELQLDRVLMVDYNPHVLSFNADLAELISHSNMPAEVIKSLWDKAYAGSKLDPANSDSYSHIQYLIKMIGLEAGEYGDYHWTDLDRFARTQEALRSTPVSWIAADVTSIGFGERLQSYTAETGTRISFANLTSLHVWLKSKDFCQTWPFDDTPLVLYSDSSHLTRWPVMRFANSFTEYRQAELGRRWGRH